MPPAERAALQGESKDDLAFAYQLRDAVTRYLAAVDAWERKHGQTYRLPSRSAQITSDLEAETTAYREARRALETLVPRARLLYHAIGIRDPFNALLRVNLGAASPQSGTRASIGGNERTEVARGLVDLIAACAPIHDPPPTREPRKQSTLARLLNFLR